MELLDADRIDEIVSRMADELEGDWLLLGGALVAIWFSERRVTEDIDVVGLSGTIADRIALMDLMASLDLPVEVANSAADYFVRRVDGWRNELELLRVGKNGRIYRPTATLFLRLKLRRLSEQDLADCLALLQHARQVNLTIDVPIVVRSLHELPPTTDEDLLRRRKELERALAGD